MSTNHKMNMLVVPPTTHVAYHNDTWNMVMLSLLYPLLIFLSWQVHHMSSNKMMEIIFHIERHRIRQTDRHTYIHVYIRIFKFLTSILHILKRNILNLVVDFFVLVVISITQCNSKTSSYLS